MKHIALLFVFAFLFQSCAPQLKEVISKSTIKLEGTNTKIRDLIDIDGYYISPNFPNYGNVMFFEDGSWVYFHFKKGLSSTEKQMNVAKSIVSWLEDEQTRWGTYWGTYTIYGDTIFGHLYDKGSFWKAWSFNKVKFEVINRKTIGPEDADVFIKGDSLPSSDCWLKEQKWIWRNESDWRNYMEMIKQKKADFKKKR